MKNRILIVASLAIVAICSNQLQAATVFSDNFESDTSASYNVNVSTGNHAATFAFDYSTVGIPSAPNSGGTTSGLKLEANYVNSNAADETNGGVSVSPIGFSIAGDFNLRFDLWQNSVGAFPAGGSGSTQITDYGWGTAGTSAQWTEARDSIVFGTTGEGGSSIDWRIYPNGPVAANGDAMYAASGVADPELDDSRNHPHIYYAGFGSATPPAAQTGLFAQQTGTIVEGSTGFAWHDVLIQKRGDIVTWTMDGLLIGTVDSSTIPALGGSNIFFGQSDINNTASTSTDVRSLLFGLVDNVVVDAVPEPASFALLGVSLLGLVAAGRKRR